MQTKQRAVESLPVLASPACTCTAPGLQGCGCCVAPREGMSGHTACRQVCSTHPSACVHVRTAARWPAELLQPSHTLHATICVQTGAAACGASDAS